MGIIINGQNDTIGPVDNTMSLLGTVGIGGTMTIEDFTNIDSVGLVTARNGLRVDGDYLRVNTNVDSALELNATDDGPVYSSLRRSGTRVAYYGFGGSGSTFNITNEVANGQLIIDTPSHFSVNTNNAERLRITSAGDMGLGTASPRNITNFGSFAINGTAGAFTDYFLNGTRTGTTAVDSNGFTSEAVGSSTPFRVITNGTEKLRIDSSGNFGLGTSSPNVTGFGSKVATINIASGSNGGLEITKNNVAAGHFTVESAASNDIRIGAVGGSAALTFQTGGSERARIDSSGNLNLVSSSSTLTDLNFTDSALNVYARVEGGKSGSGVGDLRFHTYSGGLSEQVRITSGGDVLIADTTNAIYDDSTGGGMNLKANGQLVLKKQATSTADPLMWLNDTGQTTNKFILFAQDGTEKASIGLAGNDLRFARDGYNETLRITDGGMVGINMTPSTVGSSTYMLQMYNAGSQCFMSLGEGSGGNGPLNGLVIGVSNAAHYITGRENRPMIFGTNDTERLRITSDGRVSINYNNPNSWSQLTVKQSGADISGTADTASNTRGLQLWQDQNDDKSIGLWFTTGGHLSGISGQRSDYSNHWGTDLRFYTHSPDTSNVTQAYERLRITDAGYVGINKTSPTQRFHMSGAIRQDGAHHNVQCHQACFAFSSGATHTIYTLSGNGNDATAIAVFEYVCLYAYAGINHESGIIYASTRRTNNNTAWNDIDNIGASQAGNDTNIRPNLFWDNGVLKITVGSSVQCTGTLRLTTRRFTVTRNYSAG